MAARAMSAGMIVTMKTILAVLAAGALVMCTLAASVRRTDRPSNELVRVPDAGIQPEAVVDGTGTLHLLYFAGEPRGGDLFYVRSPDYGKTFSARIRVNSQRGSAIATGTIRGGQLAIGRGGTVHVVWNGSDTAKPRGLVNPASGKAEAPFLYSRFNRDGTGFEPQRDLARRSYGVDGGGSIAADPTGHVFAACPALPVGRRTAEDHPAPRTSRSA